MKGHMQDGKFHPHTDYKKGVRKSRDQKVKSEGVQVERKARDLHTLFQHNWDNSSIRLRKELIKNAIATQQGVHADPSKAIESWSDQKLEKLPISLRNTIGVEVTFGSPKLRNEFWKHKP